MWHSASWMIARPLLNPGALYNTADAGPPHSVTTTNTTTDTRLIYMAPRHAKKRNINNAPIQTKGGGSFQAALTEPFSDAALGAQIPDLYSFPTETTHVRCSIKIKTGGDGNFDFVMFPHPLYTAWTGSGIISGGSPVTVEGAGLPSSPFYQGAVSPDALSQRYDDYRVVGGGLRLKWINNFEAATGRIFYAQKPSAQYALGSTSADASGNPPTEEQCYQYLDLPYDGSRLPVTILNLPLAGEVSATELMESGNLAMNLRVCSADFTRFRDSEDSDRGPVMVTENEATDGINNKISPSYIDMAGWSCCLLRGTGLPANSDVLDVEIIMHLEGTPALAASGSYLVGGKPKINVNPASMWATIAAASRTPFARFVASAITRAVPAADRAARVLGLMKG